MNLHVLGTAGYHPNETAHTTCLMIPELGIIFDAGTGFFRVRELMQSDQLHVFLTHSHLDHVVGLTYLYSTLQDRNDISVKVYGEFEKLQAVREHLFHESIFPVKPPFESCPLTDQSVQIAKASISKTKLQHPGGSIGFRLDLEDRSMALITDTTAKTDANYIDFIRGVDLLVHECNFSRDRQDMAELTGHSCLPSVCEVAKKADVKKLLLVHLNPWPSEVKKLDMENAKSIFHDVTIAQDGMIVPI